jgi:predicted dehydrogenase
MSQRTNRRTFLKTSAATGIGFWVAGGVKGQESRSPNEQIQVACCGVGGKGDSDSTNASRISKIFAVCDVDRTRLDLAAGRFKTDYKYTDFRELFDQLGDRIDAVTVSTPDHNHAVIAAKAMKMGKHVYCQKPLTRSIWEARRLGEIAREKGVSTQMGNQYTAYNPMREAAYRIRSGNLGNVSEVHVWTNRPIWPQGGERNPSKPVPEDLDWEAWLGPAPWREYADGYHPFAWRGWWDFGTGSLGDMACHTCNLPFMALNMRDPTEVQAETSGHNRDSYPMLSRIQYTFPELDGRAGFTMYWYDKEQTPPREMFDIFTLEVGRGDNKIKPDTSGCLIIGDKGQMYAAGDYAERGIEIVGAEPMDVDYPQSEGRGNEETRHVAEWINGIHHPDQQPTGNFPNYSGPLTETILLGNLAVWKANKEGQRVTVKWDAKNLKADDPELQQIVHPEFREGYEV